MDILQTIESRRSIRAFKGDPLPREIFIQILEAACSAKSAGNRRARDIIVVMDRGVKRTLAEATLGQEFIEEAPIDLVFCTNLKRPSQRYEGRGCNLYYLLDAAASVENTLLAAHSLGPGTCARGTCWVGALHNHRMAEALGLPLEMMPIAIVPLGYPTDELDLTQRLPFEEFVHLDRFGQCWRAQT